MWRAPRQKENTELFHPHRLVNDYDAKQMSSNLRKETKHTITNDVSQEQRQVVF